jgi:hypothetical protein
MIVSQNWASSPPVEAGEDFLHMQQSGRNLMRGIALPAVAVSLMLGACSMERVSEMVPKTSDLTNFEWNPYSKASMAAAPALSRAPVTAADYVSQDGSCAGAASEDGVSQPVVGGIALQMTECAVVRILGAPERIDIAANERGDRTATILYSRGDRPGRYYFTSGQLTLIERVAEPAPPPKPQKPAAKPRRTVS